MGVATSGAERLRGTSRGKAKQISRRLGRLNNASTRIIHIHKPDPFPDDVAGCLGNGLEGFLRGEEDLFWVSVLCDEL